MKFFLVALFMISSAQATNILGAKVDSSQEFILVDVFYWGGHKPTKFHLKDINCTVEKPTKCQAYLAKEVIGMDTSEGPVKETAVISIEKYNLGDYEGAELTIYGQKDPIGDNKATVNLPWKPVEWY